MGGRCSSGSEGGRIKLALILANRNKLESGGIRVSAAIRDFDLHIPPELSMPPIVLEREYS
jgi:hypothetical protein